VTMFSALLFDLDGTIIDSAPDVCASVNRALDSMGRPPITVEDTKMLVGFGAHTLCEKTLALTGKPGNEEDVDLLLTGFLDCYRKNPSKHTTVFPGALKALNLFKDADIQLGICTNKPEATCFPVLDALKLRHFFSSVICGDTLEFRKPDPRHIFHTLDEMGAKLSDAAFVGDSEADVEAANNAGLPCILVTFGYCHAPFNSLNADAIIDHFDDLDAALKAIAISSKK
jgi:phosphoglycolate phosphatase